MPGKTYGIYESVGSTREPVTHYGDLSNHHPSKNFAEPGRHYEVVDGRKEEVLYRNGQTLVSKDLVLFDNQNISTPSAVTDAAKRVPVPAPFAGTLEVDHERALVIIRDPATQSILAQIRHMSNVPFSTGDTVAYGEPLGTQSNQRTAAVHTHMDIDADHLQGFDRYLKDLHSGAITSEGYQAPQQTVQDKSESAAPTPNQQAQADLFKAQLGERLTDRGYSELQIETLSAAAGKLQARYAAQGDAQQFFLSHDGHTIAMQQAHQPLREFDVDQALTQTTSSHWQEAAQHDGKNSQRGQISDPVAEHVR